MTVSLFGRVRPAGVALAVALLGGASCRSPDPSSERPAVAPSPPPVSEAASPGASPAPPSASLPDSLVLEAPDGYQIWFAEGREARDSGGGRCLERSVEIRRHGVTRKVPLLFTARAPTILDRRSVRAALMRDCRIIGFYRVDLETGRPSRLPR